MFRAETESVRAPRTRLADLVLVGRRRGRAVVAHAVEVQRTRDAKKKLAWPVHCAGIHAQLGCPTYLVVIALDARVARWAARPIETFQPGSRFAPIVIGPDQLPVPRTARAMRRDPAFAVLAALASARGPHGGRIVGRTLRALGHAAQDLAMAFADIAIAILDEREWQEAMAVMRAGTKDRPSPFAEYIAAEGRREGEQKGR